jgi:transketolase
MRRRCLEVVYRLAQQDRNVVFIGSDLGAGVLDDFKRDLPGQWFMEGVSEQHVIGMAAGLALSGKTVFVNTIATFLTRRCFEQSAMDLGLAGAKVRLLGSGGGLVYAPLGPTHIATEDLALMRSIPNMAVVAPCDAEEMERALLASAAWDGPMYVRIAKGGDRVVSRPELGFELGHAVLFSRARDVLLVTTGIMLQRAIDAAAILDGSGMSTGIVHCHTVKPFDTAAVVRAASAAKAVLSLEEHTILGGLGSAVAEALAEGGLPRPVRFKRLGLPDVFPDEYGSQDSLMERYGLTPGRIAAEAQALLSQGDSPVSGD